MSTITIFKHQPSLKGDHSGADDALAVINCDDVYDDKILDLEGEADLKNLIKKSSKWKYFIEINLLDKRVAD